MTKRSMYETMIEVYGNGAALPEDFTNEAIVEFFQNEIELLDKKTAKSKERAVKTNAVHDELAEALRAVMSTEEFMTIPEITAAIEVADVTVAKISSRLGRMAKSVEDGGTGEVESTKVSVATGEGQKKRVLNGYRLIG